MSLFMQEIVIGHAFEPTVFGDGYQLFAFDLSNKFPARTFSDSGISDVNPRPVVSTATGFPSIYLGQGYYSIRILDDTGALVHFVQLAVGLPATSATQGTISLFSIEQSFSPGESITTDWFYIEKFTQVHVIAETDVFGTGTIEWSDDGITPKRINEDASATLANPATFDGAINANIYVIPFGKFIRARWDHGSIPGSLHARFLGVIGPSKIPITQVGFPFDNSDHVVPVKAAVVRQDPTDTYVNQKQGGIHPDLSTDTPLVANGVFRSPWVDVQGFVYIGATIRTDQPSKTDGATVQFAREVFDALAIENITQANPAVVTITGHGIPDDERVLITGVVGMTEVNERYFFINVLSADTFELVGEDSTGHTAYSSGGLAEQVKITREVIETVTVPIPGQSIDPFAGTQIQDAFVRVEYFNGPVAQGIMNLHFHIMDVTQTGDLRIVASQEMEFSSAAQYTKALLYAHPDEFSKPIPVFQDVASRGIQTHLVGQDIDVDIDSLNLGRVGQFNVGSVTPLQIATPRSATCKALKIANHDADNEMYYGFDSGVTATNGSIIFPLTAEVLEITDSLPVYVITDTLTGSPTTTDRTGAVQSSSGITSPNNLLTSDNVRVTDFDVVGDTVTLDTFTAANTDPITKIELVLEARRSTTNTTTPLHVATVTGTAGDVPAVSTSGSVTANASHFYLAAITFRDSVQTVTGVSGLGLTWAQVASKTADGGFNRTEVWAGSGTATLTGIVTASLSAAADNAVIAVSRFSGVDLADPIETTATQGTGTPSTAVSGVVNANENNDRVYSAVGMRRRTATPGSGFTEHADLRTGTTANDAALQVQSKLTSGAPGNQTCDATITDGTSDWALVMVVLNKNPGSNPEVTVSHSEGATTLVAQVTNTGDQEFVQDVTGDASWDDTLVSTATMTATLTAHAGFAAEVDAVFFRITQTPVGGTIRGSFTELSK